MTAKNGSLVAVGVGPGDPSYITLAVKTAISEADVVAGFHTVLDVTDALICGERLELDYRNQEAGLETLGKRLQAGQRCVLCLYGDLNVSAGELLVRAEAVCGPAVRLPGISSIQVAMARAGLAMETSLFFTLHKRACIEADKAELLAAAHPGRRDLIVLPRPYDFMPPAIAAFLLAGGVSGARRVLVCERLTLEGKEIHRMTLEELAHSEKEFSDLSVLLVRTK